MPAYREPTDQKFRYGDFFDFRFLNRFASYMHRHRPLVDGQPAPANWKLGESPKEISEHLFRHVIDLGLFLEGVGIIRDEADRPVKYEEAIMGSVFNLQALWLATCGSDFEYEINRGAE